MGVVRVGCCVSEREASEDNNEVVVLLYGQRDTYYVRQVVVKKWGV